VRGIPRISAVCRSRPDGVQPHGRFAPSSARRKAWPRTGTSALDKVGAHKDRPGEHLMEPCQAGFRGNFVFLLRHGISTRLAGRAKGTIKATQGPAGNLPATTCTRASVACARRRARP
jgi:hypothetical protein